MNAVIPLVQQQKQSLLVPILIKSAVCERQNVCAEDFVQNKVLGFIDLQLFH